jgi:hypothetical protein
MASRIEARTNPELVVWARETAGLDEAAGLGDDESDRIRRSAECSSRNISITTHATTDGPLAHEQQVARGPSSSRHRSIEISSPGTAAERLSSIATALQQLLWRFALRTSRHVSRRDRARIVTRGDVTQSSTARSRIVACRAAPCARASTRSSATVGSENHVDVRSWLPSGDRTKSASGCARRGNGAEVAAAEDRRTAPRHILRQFCAS